MDQGMIASFKAYYLRRTIAMALQATEMKKDLTLMDFWKSYNILDAVKNIADSWEEVKMTNMNGVWRKLCPQFVNDFHGFEDTVDHVIKNIVALSKEIDLDMEVDDVTELLESHGEELSAGDLIQLEKQIIEEEEETPIPDPKAFTRKGLSKGFAEIQQALATFEAQDPNMDGFTRVSRGIMDLLQCYMEILDEKRSCLSSITWSAASTTPDLPATEPLPSTSAASIATEPLPSTSAASIAREPPSSTSAASIASPPPSVASASPPDSPAPASQAPSVASASPADSPAPASPAPSVASASPAPASPASSVSLSENPDTPAPVSPASSAASSPQ
ncbi:tigger transposable element-derived protein 1-like [Palaemon carinicauda]|uniref:tigger transposable element-derived protein 1-like n=1 Tax=Palaemon carinicauda TaxID=392227 RepID=UPI0035B5A4EE